MYIFREISCCCYPLPHNKNLDMSKLKGFADDKINVSEKLKFDLEEWKTLWERRNCWKPAVSPFLTMFSKAFFFRVVQSQDHVVNSYGPFIPEFIFERTMTTYDPLRKKSFENITGTSIFPQCFLPYQKWRSSCRQIYLSSANPLNFLSIPKRKKNGKA